MGPMLDKKGRKKPMPTPNKIDSDERSYVVEFLEYWKTKNLVMKFKKEATIRPPNMPGIEKDKD